MKKHLVGLIMGLLILIPSLLGWWENAELNIYDHWFTLHGSQDPGQEIVLVGMDEKSISQLGPLPWGRDVHVRFLQQLQSSRLVAFDILFDTNREKDSDQALAAAIKEQGHVVLSSMFTYEPNGEGSYLVRIKPPIDILARACSGVGFINMAADKGNTVRKTALFYPQTKEKIYPSFSLAVLMAAQGIRPEQLSLREGQLIVGDLKVPVENRNQAYLNFWGPGQTFPTYSYIDVLNGQVPARELKDKIVLVGPTSPAEKDYFDNPYTRGNMLLAQALPVPGVEIHASAVKSFLTGSFFRRAPGYLNIIILLAVWVLVMESSRSHSPWKAFILTATLALGLSLLAYSTWLKGHYWLNLASPLLIIAATYTGNTVESIVRTNLEKRRIRNTFSRYVSPAVVDSLLQQENPVELGGLSQEISILFSDIRGFTAYSEGRPAQEVVARLNEYFTAMTEIVFRYGGTLDKYLGDGLLAYFGAPVQLPDHSGQALAAAVEMLDTVERLNQDWEDRGEAKMKIGLGVHSGTVVVGNIGSPKRLEYTIIGENVNLASRLEGLNKDLNKSLVFSGETYALLQKLPAGWTTKYLGDVPVRGLKHNVKLYTLEPEPKPETPDVY
ncbi:MAG: adenylate/guanylate cyclase domain-containing protein [Syntrophomonadaceae bacterium]